jgi:hypothetical protein
MQGFEYEHAMSDATSSPSKSTAATSSAQIKVILCSCERTFRIDVGVELSGAPQTAHHLCRSQLSVFTKALADTESLTVGCTQEAPLFQSTAIDLGSSTALRFVDVRGLAGWSDQGDRAGPKIAALIAAEAEPSAPAQTISAPSGGVALIYGRDETAIEVGRRLADTLDVTVLLTNPSDVVPPRKIVFPVLKGTVVAATGHFGAFSLVVDDFAPPLPSSRAKLVFELARNGPNRHAISSLTSAEARPSSPPMAFAMAT